jgi:hypothetical protein
VARDVRDAYVTTGNAKAAYGVILNADGSVDEKATERQRAEIRADRIGKAPARAQSTPSSVGIAVVLKTTAAGSNWACGYCEHELGGLQTNWRHAAVRKEWPIAKYFERLEMHVRPRISAPDVLAAECCCPSCGGLLAVEIYPAGFEGFTSPRLRSQDA